MLNNNRQSGPAAGAIPPPRDNERIRPLAMLVDDCPDIVKTTARFLENAGFDVMRAENGTEALGPLSSGLPFALLVTDYAMPELNGVDLATRAQERLPQLKVLLITGYPGSDEFSKLPANVHLLVKPFRRRELLEQVDALFAARPHQGCPA